MRLRLVSISHSVKKFYQGAPLLLYDDLRKEAPFVAFAKVVNVVPVVFTGDSCISAVIGDGTTGGRTVVSHCILDLLSRDLTDWWGSAAGVEHQLKLRARLWTRTRAMAKVIIRAKQGVLLRVNFLVGSPTYQDPGVDS